MIDRARDRAYNAEYYDAVTTQTNDVTFYERLVSADTRVLELGCGTGRVTLPLARRAKRIVGVDRSEPMIVAARAKDRGGPAQFVLGDITALHLGEAFDLVIAPFRVLQSLDSETKVTALMRTIREHLAPGGTAVLNAFMPRYAKAEMARLWPTDGETEHGEATLANGDRLTTSDTRRHMDAERQVLYPELIYRRYRDGALVDEHVNPISMRYYYPDQLIELVAKSGFTVTETWGGYDEEAFGDGPELVVAFTRA